MSEDTPAVREQLRALLEVGRYRPGLAVVIVALSLVVAALEGVGLGFILPIIEVAQGGTSETASGPVRVFAAAYAFLGLPFTIESIIAGVGLVIAVRYAASFLMAWLAAALQTYYVRDLRARAFESALDAEVGYFDREGSDEILNAIITQTSYAGGTINHFVRLLELTLTSTAYVLVALYLAPYLMVVTGLVLGALMLGVRHVLESGYSVGGRVADANERVQQSVQAGMQGIRDVKLFRMREELFGDFRDAVDQYTEASITRNRNQAAINNANRFLTAATVFALIYVGLEFSTLSLGGLGVFLFAMFRLGPKLSAVNDVIYRMESDLPHLIRTQRFLDRLEANRETGGDRAVPAPIDRVAFEDVAFAYEGGDETVLRGVSFAVESGEFAAFVGPSGAGKSTIVALLARLYDPDGGRITADGTPIGRFDVDEWRGRVSVVRQDPFVFNDTLRYNVTIGNRDASQAEIERVCEIAQVTEFLEDLPRGYDTVLGDDGVRLSGGQRQRVAIARALLKDADLLVLDEATSDLDSHLEERVHRGIEEMDRDYAMVAIAHRLSTVTGADCIHVMEDGDIVESGTHRELVSQDGTYAALYATQAGVQ